MTALPQDTNEILGTTSLSVLIHDLRTASQTAQRILALGASAANITKLSISTEFTEAEETAFRQNGRKPPASDLTSPIEQTLAASSEAEDEAPKQDRVSELTSPIVQILTTITATGGSLAHFSWLAPDSTGTPFTRPASFWSALYAHAPTLDFLQLDFFEHEVHNVPPPVTNFPVLTTLVLDTNSAHGDDGTAIHVLLKSCPMLSKLTFDWPGCDLLTCQIQDIDWDSYTFPHLTHLSLNGWDFAPQKLTAFLARHDGVEVFRDAIDGDEAIPLDMETFPVLHTLSKRGVHTSSKDLVEYFDPRAKRAIKHLALDIGWGGSRDLENLGGMKCAREKLEVLELRGDVKYWRPEDESSEDESGKDESGKDESGKDESSEDESGKDESTADESGKDKSSKDDNIPPTLSALQTLLTHFHALHTLTITLESGNIYSRNPETGKYEVSDNPPDQQDLVRILAHIPPQHTTAHSPSWRRESR
jgi:hypothetical protein